MNSEQLKKLEKDLWAAVDNFRANKGVVFKMIVDFANEHIKWVG